VLFDDLSTLAQVAEVIEASKKTLRLRNWGRSPRFGQLKCNRLFHNW